MASMSDIFICTICKSFGARSYKTVLSHIGNVHRFGPSSEIHCGIDGCPASYRTETFTSFRSHVYRKHRDVLMLSDGQDSSPLEELNMLQNQDGMSELVDTSECGPQQTVQGRTQTMKNDAAIFLLKTQEERRITQTALNGIIADCQALIERILSRVQDTLSENGVDLELSSILDQQVLNPFDGLQTEFKRANYFKENFKLIEPVERILRSTAVGGSTGKCYDVPLLDSLQQLLYTDAVRDHVFNSHALDGDHMGDYCDGSLYKSHPLFNEDPHALQIQLYYDDAEVCNPIGSRKGVHKLGLFYYTLGNLPPRLRSGLNSIQLITVCKTTDIDTLGIDKLLQPFLDAIKMLEMDEGVEFTVDGRTMSLRGTVTLVSADNLASQAIGGYKALHSAFRKCRYCMAVDEDLQKKFLECDFQLRSRTTHESHCTDLNGPLREHISTTYGLVRDAALNTCRYFHVVDGLVPDVMHDVLEGALTLTTKLLLQHFILQEKLFSLNLLNVRISSFKYGSADSRNKPSHIGKNVLASKDSNLTQSASQMWCLGRVLPFLIGDQIPESDEYWDHYLSLLSILELIFAPKITMGSSEYLAMLIEDYLTDFTRIYERRLTPKMHYMIHIPSWMNKCGPLVHVWCMRYESKHSYFKQLARVIGNFKNIQKTLAYRHQRYMCLQLHFVEKYLSPSVSCGKNVTSCTLGSLDEASQLVSASPALSPDSVVYRVSTLVICGTKYRKNDVLIYSIDENDEPAFVTISHFIVTSMKDYFFVVKCVETLGYSYHYHAYNVYVPGVADIIVCTHSDLKDYHPMSFLSTFDDDMATSSYVQPKYRVF